MTTPAKPKQAPARQGTISFGIKKRDEKMDEKQIICKSPNKLMESAAQFDKYKVWFS